MSECNTIFCKSVSEKLDKMVKGWCYVYIKEDRLVIEIHRRDETIFCYSEYGIFEKIINGCSVDIIVDNCLRAFKKRIHDFYFYK